MYQAQRRQPKIKDIHTTMTTHYTQFYQSYIANNKPNKRNPNNKNNDINVGFTNNTKFVLLQLRHRKFWSFHIQILSNFKKIMFKQFLIFHPSPVCTFHRSRKTCTWLDQQFRTFQRSLHESVALRCKSINFVLMVKPMLMSLFWLFRLCSFVWLFDMCGS